MTDKGRKDKNKIIQSDDEEESGSTGDEKSKDLKSSYADMLADFANASNVPLAQLLETFNHQLQFGHNMEEIVAGLMDVEKAKKKLSSQPKQVQTNAVEPEEELRDDSPSIRRRGPGF